MSTQLKKLIPLFAEINPTYPSWEELSGVFNLYLGWSDDKRLKAHYIKKWLCTDTEVGIKAYYLDGEFVALSSQSARKARETFSFISVEAAQKVKLYLDSLLVDQFDFTGIKLLSEEELSEELPELFTVDYNTHIMHKEAYWNGMRVKILNTRFPPGSTKYFHTVLIQTSAGKQIEVSCKELGLEYNENI